MNTPPKEPSAPSPEDKSPSQSPPPSDNVIPSEAAQVSPLPVSLPKPVFSPAKPPESAPPPESPATDSNIADEPEVSVTARATKDAIGLGRTPAQRGAEVIAGIRAELTNSPEAIALSRTSGRVFTRLLANMGRNRELLRFIPARMLAMTEVVKRSLPKNKTNIVLVEIAGGFSPRSIHMAQMLPEAQVIEIDLPDVVEEKQRRLKSGHIEIPSNLSWRSADLGVTSLADVLGDQKADIVCAEGLNLYFKPPEIIKMNDFVRQALVNDGLFITEVYYQSKFAEARNNPNVNSMIGFFLRQAGQIPGLADSDETVERWFTEAGFGTIERTSISQVMKEIGEPVPVLDVAVLVTAHNDAKPQSTF